jgi:3-oxoacyl-[acyl-carrier protein] reductase
MKLLEGKVVLITGASRGIGKAIAEECASHGAKVAFTYLSSDEKAKKLAEELTSKGGEAIGFKSNAAKYDEAQDLVERVVEKFGTVDVLINNAGITQDTLLMRMTEDQWDEVIETNLKSVFNLTKAVQRPMLKQRKGSIINMSSVVGVSGNAGQANYAASKAGMIGFTKSIAQELGSRNIRCNAIAPGFIETEMTGELDEKVVNEWRASIPLKRGGAPLDVANATVFLASDMSAYITGQTIHVCGGMLM